MAMWKVTPNWKKSCIERQFYVKDGMTIVEETGWRWGEFFIQTEGDEPPEIDEDTDIFCIEDAELMDWSTDDGCWGDIEYYNVPEDVKEELEAFFEEGNSIYDLEEKGWMSSDGEMYITCDVTIEKVEE
jgi:hypothetical protein